MQLQKQRFERTCPSKRMNSHNQWFVFETWSIPQVLQHEKGRKPQILILQMQFSYLMIMCNLQYYM